MSGMLGKYKFHLIIIAFLVVMITMLGTQMSNEEQRGAAIIPQPNALNYSDESIGFVGISKVVASDNISEESKRQVYKILVDNVVKGHSDGLVLYLEDDKSMGKEQYSLEIKEEGIFIFANTDNGFFYGFQSLKQLLAIHQNALPVLKITDNPRFSWRGLHLDVSRHFFGVDKIKEILDWMAFYKLNHFHWHLVDDQGWRIEIKNYPRLTTVGGVRTETDGSTYGPYFYTQEQIKDVVNYAAERHIEVVPEIELPGHSTAAIAAYPWLSCLKKELKVGNTWGVYEDVYCAGDDAAIEFMENVLTEVFELFPSHYVHIGADECPKGRWEQCPKCQERIKKEKLADEYELQAYFVERIADFLKENGKALIGWDEILQGYLAEDAVVMSWHGIECGEIAARGGNPA
ncbi:MAG: beta-N-acetylhexosaminidase, partial [Bacteroidales bacterium]|nr:beta-N-acetylhexosaminidase [Bacteroidales bacterium]